MCFIYMEVKPDIALLDEGDEYNCETKNSKV